MFLIFLQLLHSYCQPWLFDLCFLFIGWTGVYCDQVCPNGTYGLDRCANVCKCENGAACNPKTGACTCASGYKGAM